MVSREITGSFGSFLEMKSPKWGETGWLVGSPLRTIDSLDGGPSSIWGLLEHLLCPNFCEWKNFSSCPMQAKDAEDKCLEGLPGSKDLGLHGEWGND